MSEYIARLKDSLKSGKIGLAKTLLAELGSKHVQEKLDALEVLALTPDKAALEVLAFLISPDHRDPDIYDRLVQLTTDRAHLNFKFIFILLNNADEKTINQSVPLVRHILSNETDKDLLKEILRTIGKLKIEQLVDDISEFIFYDAPILKAESIKALERIGSEKALSNLIEASKTDKCDQDILDSIQVLSSKEKEQPLPIEPEPDPPGPAPEDTTKILLKQIKSKDFEKRFEAIMSLSQEEPKVVSRLFKSVDDKNHDLKINLLKIIKRTIPLSAVISIFDMLNQKKEGNSIKFSAYSALESYPELKSAAAVVQGISESSLAVRLAAIMALDKNLSDFVFAEIRNKIESGTKKGEALAENILDALAKNIIEHLMVSDTFSYIASNYLSKSAPIQSLETFIEILENRKLRSTAKKYQAMLDTRLETEKKLIVVVSSYDTILNTYNKLINSCGFSALLFSSPQDAFETLLAQRPDAILCDLFLNDITAIDFASEIREMYTKEEVPFIISTLQKDLDDTKLANAMDKAGITSLCEFPAKTSQIKSWIKS